MPHVQQTATAVLQFVAVWRRLRIPFAFPAALASPAGHMLITSVDTKAPQTPVSNANSLAGSLLTRLLTGVVQEPPMYLRSTMRQRRFSGRAGLSRLHTAQVDRRRPLRQPLALDHLAKEEGHLQGRGGRGGEPITF